jgi:hypothetical protein
VAVLSVLAAVNAVVLGALVWLVPSSRSGGAAEAAVTPEREPWTQRLVGIAAGTFPKRLSAISPRAQALYRPLLPTVAATGTPPTCPLCERLRKDLLMTDERVRVLDADPELAEGLSAADAASASQSASAPVHTVRPGAWQPDLHYGDSIPPGGLLVLEACVSREVSVLGMTTAVDFLAHGDLLHVADERPLLSVSSSASWVVL